MKEKRIKDEIELSKSEPRTHIEIKKNIMQKSTLTGDVITDNIFNDFSKEIWSSNLSFNIKKEASQKMEELKSEVNKEHKDKSKIEKLCEWFTKNKTELVAIAAPFISKIISNIKF